MGFRREKVERIKQAREDYVKAQGGTRDDRRRAAAMLSHAVETATPEEVDQGYAEHWGS